MSHRGFDEQMEILDGLKGRALEAGEIELLRKSLTHKSNFLVAKVARLIEENNLTALVPELLGAYDRFFDRPEKTDAQCWAKNALSRALAHLECRDKEVFLRGLCHRQMEPTWGGKSDSAATLRAACAHALVACDGIGNQELLILLLDPLVDPDKSVRVEAARAIGQVGLLAVPVLRLRALIPGEEPEVLAACFASLLAIERDGAIPFVTGFLEAGDGAAAEAAFALSEIRSKQALAALLLRYKIVADPWFGSVLLSAIALTRLPEAVDFLLTLIRDEASDATAAIEAIGRTAPAPELRARLAEAVEYTGSPRLGEALRKHLPPPPIEHSPTFPARR